MRVVVINDFSVVRGGATALALLETKLLRERGIAVEVIVGDACDNAPFGDLGVPVHALGERGLIESGTISALRGLYNRRTVNVLSPILASSDTPLTIYHVHVWSQIFSPSIFAALAPYRPRVVISAHDFFLACPNGAYADFRAGRACIRKPLGAACLATNCDQRRYIHKLWRAGRQFMLTRTLRFDEAQPRVLMIHEAMREPFLRGGLPNDCLQTVPNPVSPWSGTRICAEKNREFLFVGRLNQEKGPDLAARAARRAGAPMTFVGDGPMLDSLRAAFPEFTFTGWLPAERIARLATQARALVMPSRYPEPYGLVAVEALWSGLPVLAARDALLAPDIATRGAGLAFDPRDEAAFAAALLEANDSERVRNMSVNAYTKTRDLGLSPGAWAGRLVETFAAILARAGAESAWTAALAPRRVESEDPHIFDRQD